MLLVGTEAIPFRQRLRSRRRICPKSHHTSRHRAKARVTYRKSNRTATQTTPMKLLCSRGCATIGVARPRTRHFCRRETVEVQRIPITSEDAANTSDVEEQQRYYSTQGAFTGTQDQTGPPLTPAVIALGMRPCTNPDGEINRGSSLRCYQHPPVKTYTHMLPPSLATKQS